MTRRLCAIALACATILPSPLTAEETGADVLAQAERSLRRVAAQVGIMLLRGVVDVTYEDLAIQPRGDDLVLTGLRIRPHLEWTAEGDCVLTVDRLRAGDLHVLSRLRSVVTASGIRMPHGCLDPQTAAIVAGFGFDRLEIESLSLDLSYDFPSSGAELALHANMQDVGDLSLSADFDYLFPRFGAPGGTGKAAGPVAQLARLEIAFENEGLFGRIEPLITSELGDPSALPQAVRSVLVEALSGGGERRLGAPELAFIENASGEVARFLRDRDRIVVSVAPEDGVALTAEVFETPLTALAALQPRLSSVTLARRNLIAPETLAAALSGGPDLPEEVRLRVGRALVTGEGAPKAPRAGADLLAPLADNWDGEANHLLARSLTAEGRSAEAYRHALRALAVGAREALGLADELELALDVHRVLDLQAEVRDALPAKYRSDPAALQTEADIGAIRAQAHAFATGAGAPRNYPQAYYWATLAAAAGDKVSEALIERLDRSLGQVPGGAWADAAAQASERALATWTEGGLGRRLATE